MRRGVIVPPYHFINFDGQNLADFGLRVSGAGTYGSPERDVDNEEVPGRDGDIVFDNGRWKNTDIEYEVSLLGEDEDDYRERIAALRSFLSSRRGYKRLEDTYRPKEYRMAVFSNGVDPGDEIMLRGSTFKLKFNCKPQRFLKDGENVISLTATSTIYNNTYFDAKPLLRVYGSGTFYVGSNSIKVIKPDKVTYVDIDCDMMDCFSGDTNCNDSVVLNNKEFPVLSAGENKITFGSGITKIEITPRWYIL